MLKFKEESDTKTKRHKLGFYVKKLLKYKRELLQISDKVGQSSSCKT